MVSEPYDNLEKDESLALAVHEELIHSKPEGWRGNRIKERKVLYSIKKHIKDDEKAENL